MNNIELDGEELERRGAHNKVRNFALIREEIITSLIQFLEKRFEIDAEVLSVAKPFVQLDKNGTDVEEVCRLFAPDKDIASVYLQFSEICAQPELQQMDLLKLVEHLAINDTTDSYQDVLTILARISGATPHSADVERSISANNLLKTALRNALTLHTENNYLYVYYNMPTVEEWDPRSSVENWITKKKRRTHDMTLESEKSKAKEQPHFVGVFSAAQEASKKRKNDTETETYANKKRKL